MTVSNALPNKISSYSSGIAFWVTQVGQQFLSKFLEYHFGGKGHFSTFKSNERNISDIYVATELCEESKEGFLRMANITRQFRGVYSMCISRAYTCFSLAYPCIHMKYTYYIPGNGLVLFATPKNPHFDPSLTSEILSLKPHKYTWYKHVSQLEIV